MITVIVLPAGVEVTQGWFVAAATYLQDMKADIARLYLRNGGGDHLGEVVQFEVGDDQHVGQLVGIGTEPPQHLIDGGRKIGAAAEGVGEKIDDAGLLPLPIREAKHLDIEQKRNQVTGPSFFAQTQQHP